jgi:hypothetical protein
MRDGLRAAVHDPLWLLSRQWQFFEFQGEDAGSPVRADIEVEEDALSRVDLRGGGRGDPERGDVGPFDYDGGPLEATVERERITTGPREPNRRLAAEAGQYFLRQLSEQGYTPDDGSTYAAADFREDLRVSMPEEPTESRDRRFLRIADGRALDGRAVFDTIREGIGNIEAVVDGEATDWASVTGDLLPLPEDAARIDSFEAAVEAYYEYYRELYDDPTEETGSAWQPERLEYRFAVATGGEENEAVLESKEYEGGRLDWHDFSSPTGQADDPESLDPAETNVTTTSETSLVPTHVNFPGMPASRWWEFEDAAVSLDEITAGGTGLSRLLLLEFVIQYGNDWFRMPLETEVGTFSRITELTVTDSFGIAETATPAIEDDWTAFMHDLPEHDRPGLFLPPTLGQSFESDPVERVQFGRDEVANLLFGLERLVEGPTGRALDRTEFQVPTLVVDVVSPNADPDAEFVRFANPGEDSLDISEFEVLTEVVSGEDETKGAAGEGGASTEEQPVYTFGDEATIPPRGTLDLYTGSAKSADDLGAGLAASVWDDADAVVVRDAADGLVRKQLLSRVPEALADYRLATDIEDYWFPFQMVTDEEEYRLARSLLLDASSLGMPIENLPRPLGTILDPDPSLLPPGEENLRLYEEDDGNRQRLPTSLSR